MSSTLTPTSKNFPNQEKYKVVQALRGLAALWVVLFHASEGGHITDFRSAMPQPFARILFDYGHLGVAIFFTLSGFVISHSLTNKKMNRWNWGQFMIRRSIRLDPAYWASIIVVILFGVLSSKVLGEGLELPSLINILSHLMYLQMIFGMPEISSIYWTLTYEIQFYAFFSAALIFPRHVFLLLPLACLSAAGVFDGIFPGLFIDLWASFFIGVLAKQASDDLRWSFALFLVAAPLAWSGSFGITNVITAIILLVSVRTGWAETGLNWSWLQFLGTISYSLYLIHNPLTGASGFLAHRIMGVGIWADAATLIIIVGTSIAAAYLLWIVIEHPTHRLSKRFLARSAREQPAGTGS